jgi:putative spermidine/putrescine transport system permease protein
VVNVVAVALVVLSVLPVWLATRIGGSAAVESRL